MPAKDFAKLCMTGFMLHNIFYFGINKRTVIPGFSNNLHDSFVL
jgi:hypothetical protein